MIQICVSLVEETTAAVVARMSELAGVADMFEVRGDLVRDLDLLTILRERNDPLVFSCRPVSEGGRWDDADPRRRRVLLEAVKRGYDYVDVEFRSDFQEVIAEKAGRGLIVSLHDLAGTPADLDGLYAGMCRTGADVVKIVTSPRSVAEVGRLMAFADRVTRDGGTPLIPIALGPLGLVTRVLAGRYGAPFTFASAAAGREAAAGQIPAALMGEMYRARQVSRATKVYGLLGRDVGRSLSPVMHNRAFQARGVDAVYVPLEAEALEPFLAALPALGLSGFSVTRPYKVDILRFLSEMDEASALCGSVNTVLVHDERVLQGSTTDGVGVLGSLKKRIDPKGAAVVILGAGGAARAAALALVGRGANVTVLARDPAKALDVAAAVGCSAGPFESLPGLRWDVLINATPVGSPAEADRSLVPAALHRPDTVVFDMVYDPVETRLLREAKAVGATTVDGLEMLIAQAVEQFETWTGLEAPAEEMRSAALFRAEEREE